MSSSSPSSALNVVFGCMTFGKPGVEQTRVFTLPACQEILSIVSQHGHIELDTARFYGEGSSEQYLQQLGATRPESRWKIATKCFPSARNPNLMRSSDPNNRPFTHSKEDIARCVSESLAALGTDAFDLFYLHAPDREVPFAETLEAVDAAYKAGRFGRFGISNYTADEVEQIVELCSKNGWVKPSVYQGVYNAILRSAEPELFPVLRKHGIAFYAYNPLGGGFFTGSVEKDKQVEAGSRFDPNRSQGKMYRTKYWKDEYFDALDVIKRAASGKNLTMAEIALRWITHHSILKRQYGDSVIIGASSTNHIEQNLRDLEKGPLDKEVVDAVDRAWEIAKPVAARYHH